MLLLLCLSAIITVAFWNCYIFHTIDWNSFLIVLMCWCFYDITVWSIKFLKIYFLDSNCCFLILIFYLNCCNEWLICCPLCLLFIYWIEFSLSTPFRNKLIAFASVFGIVWSTGYLNLFWNILIFAGLFWNSLISKFIQNHLLNI